jgi:hypothetical protein
VQNLLKAPLVLLAFAALSVLLTAGAAWLAMNRAEVERINVETRSRLHADYSRDSQARRLEPLNPALIQAAADDDAALTRAQTTEANRRVQPLNVTPVATQGAPDASGTVNPAGTPANQATAAAQGSATPAANASPPPTTAAGVSPTPGLIPTVPLPTVTITVPTIPVPTLIPPTATQPPQPTSTPVPPTSTPAPPPPTNTPVPTATSIVGPLLNALSCTLLGTLGSLPGGVGTTITFINQSGQSVAIYELPTLILGSPTLRATLAPGQQATLSTNSGRAFEARKNGSCIGVYIATGTPSTAIIN